MFNLSITSPHGLMSIARFDCCWWNHPESESIAIALLCDWPKADSFSRMVQKTRPNWRIHLENSWRFAAMWGHSPETKSLISGSLNYNSSTQTLCIHKNILFYHPPTASRSKPITGPVPELSSAQQGVPSRRPFRILPWPRRPSKWKSGWETWRMRRNHQILEYTLWLCQNSYWKGPLIVSVSH